MKKVLILDRDPSFREAVESLLTKEGYSVLTASTAEEGIAMAREEPFDVVLLDGGLGGAPSIPVLRQIHRIRPELPVIMISGFYILDSVVEAMKEGAFDYLSKPPDSQRLLLVIRKAVGLI